MPAVRVWKKCTSPFWKTTASSVSNRNGKGAWTGVNGLQTGSNSETGGIGPLVDPHQTDARCVKEGAIAHRAVRVRPNIPTKTPDGDTQAGRVPDQEPRFLIQKRI